MATCLVRQPSLSLLKRDTHDSAQLATPQHEDTSSWLYHRKVLNLSQTHISVSEDEELRDFLVTEVFLVTVKVLQVKIWTAINHYFSLRTYLLSYSTYEHSKSIQTYLYKIETK